MGLAIARRLADQMQGSLRVDSETGVGSCFIFEALLSWEEALSSSSDRTENAKAHILVVEDNLANQMVAEGLLRKLGYQVTVAGDGETALRCLEQGAYDLVFMDCRLPDFSGFEVTRRWRAREQGAHLPIIALTAHSRDAVAADCADAGMDAVLTKPFRRQELVEVLNAWLPAKKAESGAAEEWESPPTA